MVRPARDPRQCRGAVPRRGLHPVVACELEFYLIDPRRTRRRAASPSGRCRAARRRAAPATCRSMRSRTWPVFLSRVDAAAAAQRLPVCGAVAEYGVGQYEVNLRHVADPMLAADQAVLLKRLVKGVARSLGMEATFMAKPFMAQPGSGLHVHVSLVDEAGRNRFGAAGRRCAAAPGHRRHAGADVRLDGAVCAQFQLAAALPRPVRADQPRLGPQQPQRRLPRAARGRARRAASSTGSPGPTPVRTWRWRRSWRRSCTGSRTGSNPRAPIDGRAIDGDDADFPGDLIVALDRLESSKRARASTSRERYLRVYSRGQKRRIRRADRGGFHREYDFYA